jgi:chemotaxis signal transduction protein
MRALLIDTVREGVERRWAIACGAIVELLPVVRWRELPDEPAWLLGVFERQRRLLPLVDLSVRLGGSPGQRRLGTRIVVVRLAPERADGGLGGLLANGAIGIDTIDWTTVGAHSALLRGARPSLPRSDGKHVLRAGAGTRCHRRAVRAARAR